MSFIDGNDSINDNGWTNSVSIRNLCIDLRANYPLYVDGGGYGSAQWIFDGLNIQAYPYKDKNPL